MPHKTNILKQWGTFVTALLWLSAAGCNKSQTSDQPSTPAPAAPDTLAFLALGDSYTIGEGIDPSGRWPVQLRDSLEARGHNVNPVRIVARTGWTTGNLLAALDTAQLDSSYDMVSLLIGVNNQYQNRSISEYALQFEELLNRALALSEGDTSRIFCVSIPDYGVTPFGAANSEEIASELDTFNSTALTICQNWGIPFYNITEISRTAGSNTGMLAPDNLHPSAQQYALWVESFVNFVSEDFFNH